MMQSRFQRFRLNRVKDRSGISGTGTVAEGVEFSTGQCVLCWLRETSSGNGSIATYQSIDHVVKVHGHAGDTRVEWLVP